MLRHLLIAGFLLAPLPPSLPGESFHFPTPNRALLHSGQEEDFFVGTVGRPWTSGAFGCVRTEGWQMHEGLDIKCQQRDAEGEPIDPVFATADGTVAYINPRAELSNYGKYIVLRHHIEGLEIYSSYAHLREIREGLIPGQPVKAGETIGILGRTANTAQGISKERAHLHFELVLFINDRFPDWSQKTFPGQRNDHAQWNGRNLIGLDPSQILLRQQDPAFSLIEYVRNQTELCRVLVRETHFPWLKRYPLLVRRNPLAEKEGVAGYEIALNFNGLPYLLIPRAPSEMKGRGRIQLLSVNEAEYRLNPCRRLVAKTGSSWELTAIGLRRLELLLH
jgi:peptidoglycan LD-endopeptidase LytH